MASKKSGGINIDLKKIWDFADDFVLNFLKSKRVKMAICGWVGVYATAKLGLSEELTASIIDKLFYVVIALVGGQSLSDVFSGGKTSANFNGDAAKK